MFIDEFNDVYLKLVTYLRIFSHFTLIHLLVINEIYIKEQFDSIITKKYIPYCLMFLQSAISQKFVDFKYYYF